MDLNMAKVSEVMTPKERAKLVIALMLKGFGESDLSKDEPISTEAEINQAVAACPSSQAREYNFFINLKDHVWRRLLIIMELDQNYLEKLEGRLRLVDYLLVTAPIIHEVLRAVERQPVLAKRSDYEKALERAKEQKRNEILEIDGRCGLAEQEAYEKLLAEEKIEGSDDWIDGWDDYMGNYGKTQDQLIDETVAKVKEQLKEYQKRKELTDREPLLWEGFSKYEGLSDEELRELVIKNDSSKDVDVSGRIQIPTKEDYELWQKTVSEQKERILKAVKEGKLKTKDNGIEAGSYYNWPERCQKSRSELDEENIEMGMVDGEIVWSGDPKAEKSGSHWQHVALATPLYEGIDTIMMNKERELASSFLRSLLPVKVGERDHKSDIAQVTLTNQHFEEGLKYFVVEFSKTIVEIHNYIAVIERIEQRHFDGMEIVSRDLKHTAGIIPRVLATIDEIVKLHNGKLKEVAHGFNLMGMGLTEYKFDQLDGFILKSDYKVDDGWVEKKLEDIEGEAHGK